MKKLIASPVLLSSLLSLLFLTAGLARAQESTSLRRFEPSLTALKAMVAEAAALKAQDVATLREVILKKDGRKYLFRIEGLVRLYRTTRAETAKPLLTKIKELEDAVGDYGAFAEVANYGKKVNVAPAAQVVLEQHQLQAQQHLDALLQRWFLQANPYVDSFALGLSQLRNRSDEELIEAFRVEVRELAKMDFDLSLLDEGVHELRRQLRWLNIYAEGLGDLFFVPDDVAIPNDFRRLDCTGTGSAPIVVSKSFARKISQFLTDIGNLKDAAEPVEGVVMAYVESGLAQNRDLGESMVRELLKTQRIEYPNIFASAQRYVNEFDLQVVLNRWLQILKL